MPFCTGCSLHLVEDAFSWKRKGVQRTSRCRSCQKIAKDRHYEANKQAYIRKAKEYKKDVVIVWIRGFKEGNPCTDCGQFFHYCQMDFDHLRDKDIQISQAVRRRGSQQIREELKKCDLVCSNCHRLRTFNRMKTS